MSILAPWRAELRSLIPRGFLRRDQGPGLFISDYPRWPGADEATSRLTAAGYTVSLSSGTARIGVTEEKMRLLLSGLSPAAAAPSEATAPLFYLARRLERLSVPLACQPMDVLYAVLKRLDAGDFSGADADLRPLLAQRQRLGLPLPAAAGRMILYALSEEKGAEETC